MERGLEKLGYKKIAGVDEAGRGPLAGPVVAAACLFRKPLFFPGVNDSKLLTALKRKRLFSELMDHPDVIFSLGVVSHEEIDAINIYQATLKAMHFAIASLAEEPDFLLVDGMNLKLSTPSRKVVHGDRLSQLIAAASIIAKESRDQIMLKYHEEYPVYGFDAHKGYGTAKHRAALKKYGLSPIHRRSFRLTSDA